MKYYKIIAGYAKTIHSDYYYTAEDDINPREIKKWFEERFSWLKVSDINEIQKKRSKIFVGKFKEKFSLKKSRFTNYDTYEFFKHYSTEVSA